MKGLLLDNKANNSAPPLTCDDASPEAAARALRYERRNRLREVSEHRRLRSCGCCRGQYVAVRLVAEVAGFAGVNTCGSVWVCPTCSAKIAARRRVEIQAAIAAWYTLGGAVSFVTLTMRHGSGDPLLALWDALTGSWANLTTGAPYRRARDRAGVVGWLRLVEVTQGANGWHVHVHALFFVYGRTATTEVDRFHGWLVDRWIRGLERRGFAAGEVGQRAVLLDAASALDNVSTYFTKAVDAGAYSTSEAVAWEFTGAGTKRARTIHGTSSPFALLDRIFIDGDADALDLWHEWESASLGRRQLTWSRGLRDILGLVADEVSDEELVAEEIGSSDDDLLLIPVQTWARMTGSQIAGTLDSTQAGGLAGLRQYLDSEGLVYVLGTGGGERSGPPAAEGKGAPDRSPLASLLPSNPGGR